MTEQATDYKALAQEARDYAQAHRVLGESFTADRYSRLAEAVDELRAQLDNMTTEWSAPDTASTELVPFPFGYGTDEEMARRSAAALHGPAYKRLVGPWVEVTD